MSEPKPTLYRAKCFRPGNMAHTYALLYKTCGADLLSVQMEENLWRVVYGRPPARDRTHSWAEQPCSYERGARERFARWEKEVRALERARELHGDGSTLARARQLGIDMANEGKNSTQTFDPPPLAFVSRLQRAFEVQEYDGFLCSLHATHSLANAVIFTPNDILDTIEMMRPLESSFAQVEELILCALREGIFLMPLRLSRHCDLTPLDSGERWPRDKPTLKLIERAGGLVLYCSDAISGGDSGHYVTLVHTPLAADSKWRWVIYSTNSVVARGAEAADAIERYVRSRFKAIGAEYAPDGGDGNSPIEGVFHVRALLPLALDSIYTPEQRAFRASKRKPHKALSAAEQSLVNLSAALVRRALSQMELLRANDASSVHYDMNVPEALSACAIDEIDAVLRRNHWSGTERADVASFVSVRHAAATHTNELLGECAEALLSANVAGVRAALAQLRGYWLSVPAVGLLFRGALDEASADRPHTRLASTKFAALLSNSAWLRIVSTILGASTILGELENGSTFDLPLQCVCALLCFAGYTNLREFGVPTPRWLVALWARRCASRRDRQRYLPTPSATLRAAFADAHTDDAARNIVAQNRFDVPLWLLDALRALRSRHFLLGEPHLRALAPHLPAEQYTALLERSGVSDGGPQARAAFKELDDALELVRTMRSTLFLLPYAGQDFASVVREPCTRGQRSLGSAKDGGFVCLLADLMRRFVRAVASYGLDEQQALVLCDVLACDRRIFERFDEFDELPAAERAAYCAYGDSKPRFVECARQANFAELHKQVHGAVALFPDRREPVGALGVRVPRLTGDETWADVRPSAGREAQLNVQPLAMLAPSEHITDRRATLASMKRRRREAEHQLTLASASDDGEVSASAVSTVRLGSVEI